MSIIMKLACALLLCLIMLFVLVACGGNSGNSERAGNETITYKLEITGFIYEGKDISEALFADFLDSVSPDDWEFMILSASAPIKGSSFIQVGSPEGDSYNRMVVEIGFPRSKGVELFRYYSDDTEEILQMFKDYYMKQVLPSNYEKWERELL